jgi:hypothetical protein
MTVVEYVDLPTSHWPMFSRPQELAVVIADVARRADAAPAAAAWVTGATGRSGPGQ